MKDIMGNVLEPPLRGSQANCGLFARRGIVYFLTTCQLLLSLLTMIGSELSRLTSSNPEGLILPAYPYLSLLLRLYSVSIVPPP